MQKLKQEDATDKTKSMDFGMGGPRASKMNNLGGEKMDSRSRRQMSLDMDAVATPYLLPTRRGSHESLRSITRTVHSVDDRYGRPAPSVMSPTRKRDSSVYNPSFRNGDSPDGSGSDMNTGLLGGAQRMPFSDPPPARGNTRTLTPVSPGPQINLPMPQRAMSPASPSHAQDVFNRQSNEVLAPVPRGLPAALQVGGNAPRIGSPFADPPTIKYPANGRPVSENPSEYESVRPVSDKPSEYGDDSIQFRFSNASSVTPDVETPQTPPATDNRKSLAPGAVGSQRLSMGFRPLPPDGNPDDTAEERAMRIRSFYKEYFSADDNAAAAPPMPTAPAQYQVRQYQDDYSQEFSMNYDESAVFDSETGRFVTPGSRPFAEPIARRAMTPPPRMPPRFNGPTGNRSRAGSSSGGSRAGARAGSANGGRFMPPPGPRSYSSASGQGGRPQQRRPMAPPGPLNLLPTPSKISEDSFFSPHMFAPAVRIQRDDAVDNSTLHGGQRPYSPAVPAHVPLASAFDELPIMPSPHMLRKSAAFTALDFAPPRKFKNDGGPEVSDAGSIRSNRSGTSALQVQNIRSGAYRISRIPTDLLPMKDDMAAELKPTWDMGYGKQA